MIMDETLHSVAERVKNFAIIWKVDISEVPDFTKVRRTSITQLGLSRALLSSSFENMLG